MDLGRLLFLLGVAVAAYMPIRAWVVEPIYIASGSMEPTLPVNRHLFLDKLTLSFREPRRGDIVAFRPPSGSEVEAVKRIIAVPGDVFELREKAVILNGQPLEEPYAVHKRAGERLDGDTLGPLTVPPDAYIVLGDNRDESEDSSVWKEGGRPEPFLARRRISGLVRGVY